MKSLRIATILAAAIAACSHAQPAPEVAAVPPPPPPVAAPVVEQPKAPPPPAETIAKHVAPVEIPVTMIYFAFDKAELVKDSRDKLTAIVDKASAVGATIRIEGNCDERGSTEYNIGLGQRRADAAKSYLVRLGVPADRISAISYGKERPKMLGHDEESWRENRRDDVFISGLPAVSLR